MKKLRVLAVIVISALVLTNVVRAAEQEQPMDKMRVVYSPFDFLLDAIIAQEKGYFKLLGLDFVPVTIQGGTAAIMSTLQRNEIDGCFLASSGALMAIDKGIDLIQVAGIGNRTFNLCVLKDSPIQSFQDFEGRKIGNSPKPRGPWLALKYDLEHFNVHADVIDMKTEDVMASALLSGQIDVGECSPYFLALYADKIRKVHTCTTSKYIWNSCGWWFKDEYLKKHYSAVKKFTDGLLLARLFIEQHHDEAVEILSKYRKFKTENLLESVWLPKFDLPVTIYQFGIVKTAEIMQENELISKPVDISKIVDPRFSLVIDHDY